MESRHEAPDVSRPGSSSSMVSDFAVHAHFQASVRPTNVFAAREFPTTPKKKKTIYGDRFVTNP